MSASGLGPKSRSRPLTVSDGYPVSSSVTSSDFLKDGYTLSTSAVLALINICLFSSSLFCLLFSLNFLSKILTICIYLFMGPIPVAALSEAGFCGRLLAGIAGSNPAGSMDICLL
jgi:hypothetical protein